MTALTMKSVGNSAGVLLPKEIGYEQDKVHHKTVELTNLLHEQSAHIAQGVDTADNKDEGAGDHVWLYRQLSTNIRRD